MEKDKIKFFVFLNITLFDFIFVFLFFIVNLLFPQNEKILSEIGEYRVTYEEFEKEMERYGKSQNLKDRLDTLTDEGKRKILEQIIRERLFLIDAEKEGIKLTPEEEENIMKLRSYMIIKKYLTEKIKENPVKEEEMKDYYEKNKEKFVIPEKRKLSHIIV
ncbi:MAG: SurA N-terminal domain-containing protein, partial [Candidatus Ratteibacteria bacterium]